MNALRAAVVNSYRTVALIIGLWCQMPVNQASPTSHGPEAELRAPVFVGETLWAQTELLDVKLSRSGQDIGIVTVRCRGMNQRGHT